MTAGNKTVCTPFAVKYQQMLMGMSLLADEIQLKRILTLTKEASSARRI